MVPDEEWPLGSGVTAEQLGTPLTGTGRKCETWKSEEPRTKKNYPRQQKDEKTRHSTGFPIFEIQKHIAVAHQLALAEAMQAKLT